MKRKLSFFVAAAALFCFSACNISLDENKNDDNGVGFGSVCISYDKTARLLDLDTLVYASAVVTGNGIAAGKEPSVSDITIKDGAGSFVIEKIPAGKNRIITVQALNSAKVEVFGVTIRAVVDIEKDKTTVASINWSTTPYANTLYYINEKGGDISAITDTDKQKILDLIDTNVSPVLINYESLANDFINNALQDSSSKYVLLPASISVNLGEEYTGDFKIQVCDPSSEVYSGSGTTGAFSGIAPGTWTVYLYDAAGEKIKTKTATFKSGSTTEVSFASVTDKIIVHLETSSSYKNIYIWTDAPKVEPFGAWPGKAMEDTDGDGWYDVTIEYTSINLIFNGSGQTADLTREAGEWWYKDGTWYDEDPTDNELPEIISFTADKITDVTGNVTFTITASDNKSLKKAEITINGVKKTAEFSSVSDTVTLVYDTSVLKNAEYTVSAVVYDGSLNVSAPETLVITTKNENRPPVAVITGASIAAPGKTVTYKGSSSYDPNGTVTAYKWSYTGAGTLKVDSENPSVCTVDFTSASVGNSGTLTLTVTDDDGESASAEKEITIKEMQSFDFREETIYFAMTTRFYDGDKSNNVHCWDENSSTPADDPAWRGDFKGLIEKLDYIKALGFSAVWITPVVENCSGLDYHGYHAMNFGKVDKRYESSGVDFQTLIDEVHARDMKLVLDVVLNHTGNFGEAFLAPMFVKDDSSPEILEDINKCLKLIPQDEGGLLTDEYFTLSGDAQYAMRLYMMKNTDYQNHDYHNYYHHFGFGNWDNFSVQFFQMAGDCVDLNTENPKVLKYIGDTYSKYIEMGVDAFRIDTGKHLSRLEFNYYFNDRFNEAARAAGRDNFYMFTEICAKSTDVTYRGNVENLSPYFYTWKDTSDYGFTMDDEDQFEGVIIYPESPETEKDEQGVLTNLDYWTRPTVDGGTKTPVNALAVQKQGIDTTNVPSKRFESTNHLLTGTGENDYHEPDYSMRSGLDVIDFPMHWNFDSASGAFGVRGGDKYYNDATYNVVYVDSHDYGPGSQYEKRYERESIDWAENIDLMFTFRGIPCLYYGSEVGFMKGAIIDKGPVMPLCETGRAYFGDYLEGDVKASDFGEYTATGTVADTLNHPLAKHIQRMNKIRRAIPALQKGQYSTKNCSGTIAFKRRYTKDNADSFALVTISGNATFTGLPAGTYVDVITGDRQTISDGGTITAKCSGQGNARIYVLQNDTASEYGADGKIGDDGEYLK